VTQSVTLTSAFGTPYLFNYAGLQVLSSAMTLNGTAVPAGSLLVFNGYANPDQVTAVNPTTGAVIASLQLANNYDLTAGTYDPASGHLFVIDRRASTTRVEEIDPNTAAEINSFALPFNTSSWAGLTIDPATGNLWYGSDQSTNIAELSRTGTVLRQVSLATQGDTSANVSGLSFDAAGDLLVSTALGTVYVASV
jgi:large repetitive protein